MEIGKKILTEKYWRSKPRKRIKDSIPSEKILQVIVNGFKVANISCSPGKEKELAIGFLVSEGFIENFDWIKKIDRHEGQKNFFLQKISVETKKDNIRISGNYYIGSGCGSLANLIEINELSKLEGNSSLLPAVIFGLSNYVKKYQVNKKKYGGFHAAALFDFKGKLICIYEDIGRHNCLDKIFGHSLLNGIGMDKKIVYTSGRIAIDIIKKVAKMRLPVIITNSSITHKAAKLAESLNITAIGYARGKRFNVYSGFERITNS